MNDILRFYSFEDYIVMGSEMASETDSLGGYSDTFLRRDSHRLKDTHSYSFMKISLLTDFEILCYLSPSLSKSSLMLLFHDTGELLNSA